MTEVMCTLQDFFKLLFEYLIGPFNPQATMWESRSVTYSSVEVRCRLAAPDL